MLTVVVVVDSNPVPHDNFMMVLDALNHQRWMLQVLTILKCQGKVTVGKGRKEPRTGVRMPVWAIAHLGFIP